MVLFSIIDGVLKQINFKYVEGIKRSIVEERKDPKTNNKAFVVFLEGVNFHEVFNFSDFIDVSRIESNDIGSILHIYGVSFIFNMYSNFILILD